MIYNDFVMIAAIQSLFTGLTLQTLGRKNRQDFEMRLHEARAMYHEAVKKDKSCD